MEDVANSYLEAGMEKFLAPLRILVSNWVTMVGREHRGGLLRVELFIIATKCGAFIEVLQPSLKFSTAASEVRHVTACDVQFGNLLTTLERRDLMYPHTGTMPSVDQRYMGSIMNVNTNDGWVGPYPVIRVALYDRQYSACTSKYSYPISLVDMKTIRIVSNEWFEFSDTLVEPFCSLSRKENEYYEDAIQQFNQWREASKLSPECGRHVDSTVMHIKNSELSVSMLSHLEVPDAIDAGDECYLLSDDIITCYMHLLQSSTEKLKNISVRHGSDHPPRTLFMDTWFFKSIWRGPSGPASSRKRLDLRPYSVIIIPALVQSHWILAVCYVEICIIRIYDPMNVPRYDVFNTVKSWAEAQLPNGDINWSFRHIRETRGCRQQGSIDCGVYVCKAAESLGLGIPVRISQTDIGYVRKRMIVEFMMQKATDIRWPRKYIFYYSYF